MSPADPTGSRIRSRREPPPLRPVTVVDRSELSPRLLRFTFAGEGLRDLVVTEPAASVRLLVASPGADELVVPSWNGNEFLLPDGSRPALRTFTPLRVDNEAGRLDLEIVRHPGGAVASWAEQAVPGGEAAISGPGRGFEFDRAVERFGLLGDETALPAISQLLEELPPEATVEVHLEVVAREAQIDLPEHPGRQLRWYVNDDPASPGARLVEAARALADIDDGSHVWAAGEAASMQAIRKHLFDERGLARGAATVRGYWKRPRG